MLARGWCALSVLALSFVITGCGDDASAEKEGTGSSGAGGGDTTSVPQTHLVGAHGVTIREIAIYQGVKRTLWANGADVPSEVPLVPGRDALVRVFYSVDTNYSGPVTARLSIAGQPAPMEQVVNLVGSSIDDTLTSTVNFNVPGAQIGDTFDFSIGLLQEISDADPGNGLAVFPQNGAPSHAVPASGPANVLRLVLAPFAYHADGSGRLPELTPNNVEAFRQRFMQWYPVSNVEVTVREPQAWYQTISPYGQGWENVMYAVEGFRQSDQLGAHVYYYGVFNPAQSFGQYCYQGCLLGLTFQNPFASEQIGDPGLRYSVGVGFGEVFRETAAHEIGHAHGREHAPCGQGLDPDSIDYSYPHQAGKTGVLGWDMFTNELVSPLSHTDFMSYCEQNWISDHTYIGLWNRGVNVNKPKVSTVPTDYWVLHVDGEGKASFFDEPRTYDNLVFGPSVTVSVIEANGQASMRSGHFYAFDHLPGGFLYVPKVGDQPPRRVEATVQGQFTVAQR